MELIPGWCAFKVHNDVIPRNVLTLSSFIQSLDINRYSIRVEFEDDILICLWEFSDNEDLFEFTELFLRAVEEER
jgi:hypothetical protein